MNKSFLFFFLALLMFPFTGFSQFADNQNYAIESRSSGRFLNGKNSSEVTFNQSKNNDYLNLWKLVKQNDNSYLIKNGGNDKVLSVKNGSTAEGSILILESQNGSNSQKWIITEHNGYFTIENKHSGLVITVDDDEPETSDPNPDLNYALWYDQIGIAVQRSYENKMIQEFEIEPVIYNPEKSLSVPELGWKPNDNKTIMLTSPVALGNPSYTIKDENNTTVLTGNFNLYSENISNTWNLFYYLADISQLETPGNYTAESENLTADFKIADDIYLNIPYPKGGTIKFKEIFNGFWKYNRYYQEPQSLLEATINLQDNTEYFTFNGTTYELEPYGWFDAHSRDSKVARSAKVLSDFASAYFITEDASNRLELYNNIKYGIKTLLLTQNEDGSWPAGKIRDNNNNGSPYDQKYYHWVTNVDANTAARCVRALAQAYEVFKTQDQNMAEQTMNAAVKGWDFVKNNENLVDENVKYRGFTVDILAASIAMAHATNESQYFDKADEMIEESEYKNGVFIKKTGSWPAETGNIFTELDDGCFPVICKYYTFARTNEIKEKVLELANQFTDYWLSLEKAPQGTPKKILDRTTSFGNIKNLQDYAFHMIAAGYYLNNSDCVEDAKDAFNILTGLNSFSTSYITGLGNKTPSVNFFRRSYETGIGGVLPGFTNTDENAFFQDFTAYQSTEGVAPVSSSLFYMLSRLNNFPENASPQTGDLKINEVKINDQQPGASFVEIYNNSDKRIDLSDVILEIYEKDQENPVASISLSQFLNPGDYFTISNNNNDFFNLYGFETNMATAELSFSESTGGLALKYQGNIIDKFNNVPAPAEAVNPGDIYIRKGYDNDGSNLDEHWYNAGQNINGTPGSNNNVEWETEQNAEACSQYLWDVNGVVYTESGTYTYTLPNVYNLDSLITLHLTISVNTDVAVGVSKLTAVEEDAEYQWLDCNKNFEPIEGATEQSYEPGREGSFAVRITKNGCTATSDCYQFTTGIETNQEIPVKIYPNPVKEIINIKFEKTYKDIYISIRDIEGKLLKKQRFYNSSSIEIKLNEHTGIYLLEVITDNKRTVKKIVKL